MKTKKTGRYLNLFTDFAFKWVFGRPQNKDLLIDLINSILEGEQRIVGLEYQVSERLGLVEEDRRVVFDLLCENDRGEKIIVELQKAPQTYFKDRALYYACNLVQDQGVRGEWDYHLKPTYIIALLSFEMTDPQEPLIHRIFLKDDQNNVVWSDRLNMIFVEVPKMKKALNECKSQFERWLFLFRHLHRLESKPQEFQDQVFLRLFETANIGKFPEAERKKYLSSLTEAEQMKEALKYAMNSGIEKGREEGREEGREVGRVEGREEGREEGMVLSKVSIVQNMLAKGLDWSTIQDITGLSQAEFESHKANLLK